MKSTTPEMSSHLSEEVTTLCTCWKIVRQDGKVFGFTDHDMDLFFNGVIYESETGYNRTAIRSDESYSVDNLDVTGFLESDQISDHDLRNGLFDFANVYIFMLNWADMAMADVKLRRGWFGEVTLNNNGMFETEIRGLHQALAFNFLETFQPECRADFCDPRCKLNIADFTYPASVLAFTSRTIFQATQLPVVPTTGATSVGSHRYWRITPTGTFYTDYVGFAEIKFYDQDNVEVTGGDTTAFSDRASTGGFLGIGATLYHSAEARDNNIDSKWVCKQGDAATAWWSIDFGSDKDIKSLMMVAPTDDYHLAPMSFNLEYSDNNINWFFASSNSAHWSGNGQEETWTIGTPTDDPVDYPTSLTALPPPHAGASTFVGGTVTFTTGANRGKTIEIVDYDEVTCTVTLFEATPYEIAQGDKFNIAQGCDKMFATCKVYANQNNFRGEPHVPGQDEYMRYPDATG